jgi:RNA polymerase sigma factor (sigma-70 family)
MATASLPHIRQRLNEFASSQWNKTLSFLKSRFALSQEDCEDVFQESFIIFYNYVIEGKLDNITSSFSTYFNSICRNKAHEMLRRNGKEISIIDEYPNAFKDEYEDDKIDSLLALENDNDNINERKSALVREIVKNLPEPCDRILWGYYRDGYSMLSLADMLNYKSEGTVKVTKHRCCEKFKKRYSQFVNQLFD